MHVGLEGKRVAILIADLYQPLEFWYPYYRFKEAGARVIVVGEKAGEGYRSKEGLTATADRSAADVSAGEFDAVVVPGGFAPDRMRRIPAMVDLVQEMDRRGKVVAAIRHAGWVRISARVVEGRRATCVASIRDDMEKAGARYVDEEVVIDGSLITSRTPADLPAFCPAVLAALGNGEG